MSQASAVAHQTSVTSLATPLAGVGNSASAQIGLGVSNSAVSSPSQGKLAGSPAAKKFRPAFARPSHKGSRYIPKPIPQELGNLKTYSSPDILICGNCREMFSDLVDMMEHKRDYCKLRFTCKCDSLNDETDPSCLECNNSTVPNTQSSNASTNHSLTSGSVASAASMASSTTTTTSSSLSSNSASTNSNKPPKPKWLHCVNCKSPFGNAWDLMVHVQTAHMLNIYQLADTTKLQNLQRQRSSVSPSSMSALSSSSVLSSPNTSSSSNQDLTQIPNTLSPTPLLPNTTTTSVSGVVSGTMNEMKNP